MSLEDLVVEKEESCQRLEFDVEKEVSGERWQNMKAYYEKKCQQENWFKAAEQAMHLKILFPDRVDELELESKWDRMKIKYEELCRMEEVWDVIMHQAMFLKILFPDRVKELELESIWDGMKVNYEELCKGEKRWSQGEKRWQFVAEEAMILKVLTTKEVEITDQGLELIMPAKEDYRSEITPRPERKETN